MKKIFLIATTIICIAETKAQVKFAESGNQTIEAVLNVQISGTPLNYTLPEFRYRYFLSSKWAARLRFNAGMNSEQSKYSNGIDSPIAVKKTGTGLNIMISPGLEFHTTPWGRFSPFVGLQVPFEYDGIVYTKVSNCGVSYPYNSSIIAGDSYDETQGSTFSFGLSMLAGVDFYIKDYLFLGAEIGMDVFKYSGSSNGTTKIIRNGVSQPDRINYGTQSTQLFNGSRYGTIQDFSTGGVRIGFKF